MAANQTSGVTSNSSNSAGAGTFFYDETCSFCVRSASWLERRCSQAIKIEPLGSQELDDKDAAQFQRLDSSSSGGDLYSGDLYSGDLYSGGLCSGERAIAEALKDSPYWYCRWLSATIRFKPLSPLARLVYRWVARHRHRISK